MTTQEAHIELDLLLQKVNTHWNQSFLPQEKDLFLNREVTRFIKQRLNRFSNMKGQALFDTIKRTIDIVPLLKTVPITVIKKSKKEAQIMLPFDFLYYVSSDIGICCTCINKKLINHTIYELEVTPPLSASEFPMVFTIGNKTFTIEPSDIPTDYLIESNIPVYKNSTMLIKAILLLFKKKNKTDMELKYDNARGVFIARALKPFAVNYVTANLNQYEKYEPFETDLFSEVRVENEEFWRSANNSHLSRSKDESMLSYLRENNLVISVPNGVVYGLANLTYISKPTVMDLSLQGNCNLTDEVMEEVVANTAQRLHAVVGTDNYEKYVRENILIE